MQTTRIMDKLDALESMMNIDFHGIMDKSNVLQRIALLLFLYKAFYLPPIPEWGRWSFNNVGHLF